MLIMRMDRKLSMDTGPAHLSAAVRSAAANTGVQTPLPMLLSVPSSRASIPSFWVPTRKQGCWVVGGMAPVERGSRLERRR